jgi:hypothetical protein
MREYALRRIRSFEFQFSMGCVTVAGSRLGRQLAPSRWRVVVDAGAAGGHGVEPRFPRLSPCSSLPSA